MTSADNKAAAARSNRNWVRTLIAIGVVVVLAIAGVVYYGAVQLPKINQAKDVAGCKTFLVGAQKAELAFLTEAGAKDHAPDPKKAVLAYITVLHDTANKAYTQSNPNGDLATGYKQVSLNYLTIDMKTDSGIQTGFSQMDQTVTTITNMCNTALDNAGVKSPVQTPTPSASPTN